MNYCKITSDGQAQMMPNPFTVTVSNPTEEQKAVLAELFGWLEMVQTDEPTYDRDTQYVTYHYEERSGKAVQVWEIHELPAPEPTIEERVDSLEQNVSDIIGGVTDD